MRQEHTCPDYYCRKVPPYLIYSSLAFFTSRLFTSLKLLNLPCEQPLQARSPLVVRCCQTSCSPEWTCKTKLSAWEIRNNHFIVSREIEQGPIEDAKVFRRHIGHIHQTCLPSTCFIVNIHLCDVDKPYLLSLKAHFKWCSSLFYPKHHLLQRSVCDGVFLIRLCAAFCYVTELLNMTELMPSLR